MAATCHNRKRWQSEEGSMQGTEKQRDLPRHTDISPSTLERVSPVLRDVAFRLNTRNHPGQAAGFDNQFTGDQ
jgi:hypothetical protein